MKGRKHLKLIRDNKKTRLKYYAIRNKIENVNRLYGIHSQEMK